MTTTKSRDKLGVIHEYDKRGWCMTPNLPRTKRPYREGWQAEQLNVEQLAEIFCHNPAQNLGVLLGEPSGWLIDVDLDTPLAVELADDFLPPTESEFGRVGKPRSHRLYYVTESVETHQRRFPALKHWNHELAGEMIVELRSTGAQTVVPGSVHESGESIEWHVDGEPALIAPDVLRAAVDALADEVLRRYQLTTEPLATRERNGKHHSAPDRAKTIERCRKYIAHKPPAIDGSGGSNVALNVACECYRFGLTDSEARSVFDEFNARCLPPWSDDEIEHKLESARDKVVTDGEFGHRLRDDHRTQANDHAITVQRNGDGEHDDERPPREPPRMRTVRQLVKEFPNMRTPIIDGLLRAGETMNLIAAPKVGKSWHATRLATDFVTKTPWLDRFPCAGGNVLIVDNELHPDTSAYRIPRVADASGIQFDEIADKIEVMNLRGDLVTLPELVHLLERIEPTRFALIILDAYYRFLPPGTDENDNGAAAMLFNQLDRLAGALQCGIVCIHHSSKGSQTAKAVTDVGAGAGAMSRAADCHVILRQHEADNVVVMEAACRSFPPLDPFCLRWDWPLFTPDDSLDPTLLRPERPKRPRKADNDSDSDSDKQAAPAWTYRRFAQEFVSTSPQTRDAILAKAVDAAIGERRADQLFKLAEGAGLIHSWPNVVRNKRGFATVPPPFVSDIDDEKKTHTTPRTPQHKAA